MLEITNLTKHFHTKHGVVRAVDNVSLTVPRGEILGLVGESGCGKSTLSRCVMQLLSVTSGSIKLNDEELTTLSSGEVRRRRLDFQMVFQDPYASLNPRMTVFATLAEAVRQRHGKLSKNESTKRVATLLETVGIAAKYMQKYPHEFSGGQRQRIAVARAIAPEPKLIIADEPVSALDVSIQSQILNLLRQLQRDLNLGMIFISHDLGVVHYIADDIAVMFQGKLVETASADDVFYRPTNDYTKQLLNAVPKIARHSDV